MENLNPCLSLALTVRRGLEKGESPRRGIQVFLLSSSDEFARGCAEWLAGREHRRPTENWINQLPPHRRALIRILERGLNGESIGPSLATLEEEIVEACRIEQEEYLAKLPFLMMIPLFLLLFPALLLLLIGPFLDVFEGAFS